MAETAVSAPARPVIVAEATSPAVAGRVAPAAVASRAGRADGGGVRRSLYQEIAVRAVVSLLLLAYNELVITSHETHHVVRFTTLASLLVNGVYYAAARTRRRLRLQAYVRMAFDVAFITAGLYAAGGLGAAPYVGVYAIVPVYTAIVFSSRACVAATLLATVGYLLVAGFQTSGALPMHRPLQPDAWHAATFNLLVLNIVGGLAALLAEAYRKSRRQLAALTAEIERAHDESQRLNAQIQRAGRMYAISEVVAGVTHEMRNVLQGVFGHLWLVRRKLPNVSPELDEHLAQVEQGCESAMRIIRNTLDMARQPHDETALVDIAEVIQRVTELKAYDLRRAGVTLLTDVAAGLPAVRGSAFQLQQVLLNLVSNAQDEVRTSPCREISVTARAADSGCVLEVRDTGPGIPRAVLPHVFEPFFTTKETGTGLGLAISAGIVERFGGRITAGNRRDGGAVFRIFLPAA
jgi:C4-dicarboxylate-specific signal transduction histidine kinase